MVTYIHKNGGGEGWREGDGRNVWQFVTMDICPSISLASDVSNLQSCLHLATQRFFKVFLPLSLQCVFCYLVFHQTPHIYDFSFIKSAIRLQNMPK